MNASVVVDKNPEAVVARSFLSALRDFARGGETPTGENIRNTHAGLKGINPALLESAQALGLPPGARLRLVELPLAGRSILAGISRQDNVQILSGAIPAAVLALILQGLFELGERAVIPRGLRLQNR